MKSKIQATLPNFPEEVIDQWLVPFAETDGWPPDELDGILFGRWRYLLGSKTTIKYWLSIEWRKDQVDLLFEHLDEISQSQVSQIIEAAVFEVPNLMSRSIYNLKERFNRVVSYISEHGVYPIAPVLVLENGRYKLMDGNHRVAAYFYCAGYTKKSPAEEIILRTKLKQPIWIGTEPNQSLETVQSTGSGRQ